MKYESVPGARQWMRQGTKGWKSWARVEVLLLLCIIFSVASLAVYVRAQGPGDWSTYLAGNGRTGFNGAETIITPVTAPHLKLHWTHTGGSISTQPVEANRLIYWGSWDGFEHATNLNNGHVWTVNLGKTTGLNCVPPTVGVASTPTVASVSINGTSTSVDFVGGGNGYFYALNVLNGSLIWRTFLGAPPSHFIWSSPAVFQGSVYIGMASFGDCPLVQGQFIQMNAATGAIQHTFNVVPTGCTGGAVWGSPTIDEATGTIYIATGNPGACSTTETLTNAVVALNAADLSLIASWQVPVAEQVPDGDFGSTPTLFTATIGGTSHLLVGVANKNGKYYAFDRSAISNGPLWRATIAAGGECPQCGDGSISPAAWDGTTLYVAGGRTTINGQSCKGSVRAVHPDTGTFIWEHCLGSGPVLGAVTMAPGVIVVGQGTDLNVMAAASGQSLFRYHDALSNAFFAGAASISNGVIYIGNLDMHLYAFGL
jgi:outer membrane protein assembly factor BamB